MRYCGIDIASKSSYVYISDDKGRKICSGPVQTTEKNLKTSLKRHVRGGLKVAIEAGNQTAWIYEILVNMGIQVIVVNPNKVKLIAESRRKTDKVDAKILCELLRLDGLPQPVHMPCREARALRGLLVARRQLVSTRTRLCNVVRGMLRQEGIRLPPKALLTQIGWKRLLQGAFEQEHLLEIVAAYYETFLSLSQSLRQLERKLSEYEKEDPRVALLQTMPKVGSISSLTFMAAVDEIERFSSSRKLISYSGLAPTVRSSGDRTEYGSISREGRSELRAVWIQVAHLVARDGHRSTQPLRTWYCRLTRRRGKKTAIVALARRLLTIAYHIVREETKYDVTRLKRRGA